MVITYRRFGTTYLSRNVGRELPFYVAYNRKRSQTSPTFFYSNQNSLTSGAQLISQQRQKTNFYISVCVFREKHHRYLLYGGTVGTAAGLSMGGKEAPFRSEALELVSSHFTNRTIPVTL
jgi:hypothetical protein